jgi:adenosylcobinamide amidohydrolase
MELQLDRDRRLLVARFAWPQRALSSAPVGGGLVRTRAEAGHDGAVPRRRSGRPSTGTGTDCIVVTAPDGESGQEYTGKHTLLGALIGGVVHQACARGIARWLEERC